MSEFLAEARIVVRPDTTGFRARLQEEVQRAISQTQVQALQIPLAVGTAGGIAGATAATAALGNAQRTTTQTTADLVTAGRLENTTFGRQAVILETVTAATAQKAGADIAAAGAAATHSKAQGQVQKAAFASAASMAGLRGAVLTAGTAFLAATVGFQALGKAVSSAAELETELNVFRVTAGATADEMTRVSEQARLLGQDITLPAVAAGDAAIAMTELAKAGLSVQESIDGARGVLQLATAAQIDNARASNLVANALNTFNLAGEDATKVADLLAGASIAAQGSIDDMGLAFRQAASVGELLGLSIEETVTLITALAKSGLQGSDAGTSLRVSLLRLVAPTSTVSAALKTLGIDIAALQGELSPEIFAKIGANLRSLPPAVRQTTVAMLGGADAVRAFGQLADFSSTELDTLQQNISKQGFAADLAAAQTEGLAGSFEGLKNEAAAAGITLGQLATPILVGVSESGRGVFRSLNLITEGVRSLVAPVKAARSDFAELRDEFIKARDDIQAFRASSDNAVPPALTARLNEARKALEQFGGAARVAGGDITIFDALIQGVEGSLADLAKQLRNAGQKATAGGGASGLNVQQILNRVAGFDEAEISARIRGDTNSLVAVLEEEQAFLEDQLTRVAVQKREPLRRQLKDALLGVTQDIGSISQKAATETKTAASQVAKTVKDADQALLAALGQRTDDAQRKIAAAQSTAGLQDDIRRQDSLQALIKIQITKIRNQVKDEQTRKDAIRELRIALIASRQEEDALRAQQKAAVAARIDTIQNLNIEIAQERGNETAIERAINARITRLNKQIKAAKGDQVKVKQLILERERLKNQLEDLHKKDQDVQKTGKTFAQQSFEFLQTQQGFASNLLGNLIPGFATAGLVGGRAGSATEGLKGAGQFGDSIRTESTLSEARGKGVRPVQVDTTNHLLRQILASLNGKHTQPPEIRHNRGSGGAVFDIF